MAASTASLLDYLRVDNPPIKCRIFTTESSGRISQGNTTNGAWKTPDVIGMWEDFDFDTLRTSYEGVLQKALDQQYHNLTVHSGIAPFPFCEIHDEDSLDALLVKWNQSMVSDALAMAQDFLQGHLGLAHPEQVFMVRGGQAEYPEVQARSRPVAHAKLRPDWAGVQRVQRCSSRAENMLPGDTKVGGKWSSFNIEVGPTAEAHMDNDWIEPLKQVYTYCMETESRYGYIITEKELVVLRIRPATNKDFVTPENSQNANLPPTIGRSKFIKSAKGPLATPMERIRRQGLLEYKAIPWNQKKGCLPTVEKGQLTVNLALWWLHLMASENNSINDVYPPLGGSRWNPQVKKPGEGNKRRKYDEFKSDNESGDEKLVVPRRRTRQQYKSGHMDGMNFSFEHL